MLKKGMSKLISFHKYSGNGNDFIILRNPPLEMTSTFVAAICDRHFGVGADGVLILSDTPTADGRMQIFNSDGGEAEMCGNGLRCLVTYMDERNDRPKDAYKIKTMNATYEVIKQNGKFAVEMSELKEKNLFDLSSFNDFKRAFYINTGVPHLVFEVHDVKRIDIKTRSPQYRFHKMFPNGTNVNYLQILDGHQNAYVRTYERGVEDETLSCGTGLTACGIALNHWYGWSKNINLQTRGGLQHVFMGDKIFYSGEVKFCFEGTFSW